jgi:methanesulfonate monooxygenase large subunit
VSARSAAQWQSPPALPAESFVSGDVYTDPDVFEAERERIFGKLWRIACHESEVREPFDYRTYDHLGIPLITIRGGDGRVRTFYNVCSHRGAKLMQEPSGNAERLTCFYHLWSYDAEGACIDMPRPEAYEPVGLSKDDCGLREVRTDTRLGLVFINLDDGAKPLSDFIGHLLDHFEEPMGTRELEVFHFHRAELNANWKAWMETNLDAYHTFMHVVLRRTQVDSERKIQIHPGGHAAGEGLRARYTNYKGWQERPDSLALPGLEPTEMRSAHLFPNAMLLARGTVIRLDTVIPVAPGKMVLECRGLGVRGDTPEERRQRFAHHNMYWGPLSRNLPEDGFAAEACEQAFAPGAARYQIIARDENMTGQDDGMMRNFYGEWSRLTGLPAHNPTNRRA